MNGNIIEERIYLGDYEVYRNTVSGSLDTKRETLHLSDDIGRIALVDTLPVDGGSTLGTPIQNIRYQLSNHLDSATLELDDAAAIISYEEYHPFGTTAYRSGRNQAETSLKRYRYVGKERDDETGLYYYGARYYASWLARFCSVDPLASKYTQLSPYQYAGNDPVGDIDIDGLEGTKTKPRPAKRLEEGKAGDVVDTGNGEQALLLDEVVVSAERIKEIDNAEFKSDLGHVKEEVAKTGTAIVFEKRISPTSENIAKKIESKRLGQGISKTRSGQEMKSPVVETQKKVIGHSGLEEIQTIKEPRNSGNWQTGQSNKGVIKDASTKTSKGFKGLSKIAAEAGPILDFAFLGSAFGTGDIKQVIDKGSPLGFIAEEQGIVTDEIMFDVSFNKLQNVIDEGALATEEFLLNHPELNMELIFTTAQETSKINNGEINNLNQVNDPFNPELEDAHIITRNEDRTFTKNYSFNGN